MSSTQVSSPSRRSGSRLAAAFLAAAFVLMGSVGTSHAGDIAQSPLYLTTSVPPVVMFAMSNDHQLFQKVYADFSDITDDGLIDITYADGNDY